MTENRFDPLSNDKNVKLSPNAPRRQTLAARHLVVLKLFNININSIWDKKLDLMAFFEVIQPYAVAILVYPMTLRGRWGTTHDFTTIPFRLQLP